MMEPGDTHSFARLNLSYVFTCFDNMAHYLVSWHKRAPSNGQFALYHVKIGATNTAGANADQHVVIIAQGALDFGDDQRSFFNRCWSL
jgi:hypothetical protein